MKKNEQLFYLIKSLSKAEKRHFKIFADSEDKNKNYILLFDEIDKQIIYDEKIIKMKFKNDTFVKQLHVTKNYLSNQILKSLRVYHSKNSIDTKLNNYLLDVEILYKRELFEQCLVVVKIAENLANEYEKFTLLVEILNWKRKVFLAQGKFNNEEVSLEKIILKQETILEKIINQNKYWLLTSKLYEVFGGDKKTRQKFIKNKYLQNFELADSLQSKILYYHIQYTLSTTNNKIHEAINYISKLILLLESNPKQITEESSSYITSLNNKISLLLSTKQYSEIPILLTKVRIVPEKYKLKNKDRISVKLMVRTYNVELEMYRDLKEFKKAENLIEEIQHFIRLNENLVTNNYKTLFYYQFAYIFFMRNKLSEALHWTNELLSGKITGVREDLKSYVRFLNLMIHFELGNTIVLKYAVDASRRFLKKKRNLYDFEKVLLKFFSKISLARKEEHKKMFTELSENLFAKTDERKKADVLDYIDFDGWILSH
ncbi:MAG: hypothetical protein V3V16_10510 [Melioribacteraceae bacterium]